MCSGVGRRTSLGRAELGTGATQSRAGVHIRHSSHCQSCLPDCHWSVPCKHRHSECFLHFPLKEGKKCTVFILVYAASSVSAIHINVSHYTQAVFPLGSLSARSQKCLWYHLKRESEVERKAERKEMVDLTECHENTFLWQIPPKHRVVRSHH